MTNEKRQRQDLNRQSKIEQIKSVEKKANANAKRNRVLKMAAGIVVVIALILLVSRCNPSNDTADTTAAADETLAPVEPTTPPNPALAIKPVITVPSTPKPIRLEIKDLIVGTGPEIAAGDDVDMQYAGSSWSTGEEFDSSWNNGKVPFPVKGVGTAGVIAGWNQGLIGMKEGGRRQLIVPPDLGYGPEGRPPQIGPNETLIFVVDAEKVSKVGPAVLTPPPSVAVGAVSTTVAK